MLKVSMMQKMSNIYLILTFNTDSFVENFYRTNKQCFLSIKEMLLKNLLVN